MQHEEAPVLVAREWLVKAEHDLIAGERAAQDPPVADIACFHAQQAAERALKAFLTWRHIPFQRTHDLTRILAQASSLDGDFHSLEPMAELLTPYATDPRYPGTGEDPGPEEAIEALDAARDAFRFVLLRVPPKARP